MVSRQNYDDPFPEIHFMDGWPEDRPTLGMLIPVAFAVGLTVLACLSLANVPLNQGPLVVVGFYGMAAGMLGAALIFTSLLPRIFPRWDSGVRRGDHEQYGTGVRLVLNRREQLRLFPPLIGMGVYGFCSWLDFRNNGGNNLLPFSKANDGGATVALIFCVIAVISIVLLAILAVISMTIEVYPAGILRKTPIRFRKDPEQFVPWQDIASFMPDRFSSGKAENLPIVRIYVNDPAAGPTDKAFNEPGAISLPMNLVKCDANSFLSIITSLKENPEHRHLLASPDIGQWFLQVQRCSKPRWLKQPRSGDGT